MEETIHGAIVPGETYQVIRVRYRQNKTQLTYSAPWTSVLLPCLPIWVTLATLGEDCQLEKYH